MSQREKLIDPLMKMYKVNTQKELCKKIKVSYSTFNRWYNGEIQNPSEKFSIRLGTELLKVWSYDEVQKGISLAGVDTAVISESIKRDRVRAVINAVTTCSSHMQGLTLEEITLLAFQILSKNDIDPNDAKQVAVEIIAIFQSKNMT